MKLRSLALRNERRSLKARPDLAFSVVPRRLGIEIPGGVDHVLNRGVDRADIVRDDEDRHEWFRLFNRVAPRSARVS